MIEFIHSFYMTTPLQHVGFVAFVFALRGGGVVAIAPIYVASIVFIPAQWLVQN